MRDAQYQLRRAVNAALTGQLIVGSATIGIYDELKRAAGDMYIIFGTQSSTPTEQNDCSWLTEETITLEIWHRQGFSVTKDMIDDISNQIYEILNPAVLTAGFPNPNHMQVVSFDLQQAITRAVEISLTETAVMKSLTFVARILQQTS